MRPTPCLGHFKIEAAGPTLTYLAEDALHSGRNRIGHSDSSEDSLDSLDLHVITAPSLRLDQGRDRSALEATFAALQPKLLLLFPLIRLHGLEENSAVETSTLLGFLRTQPPSTARGHPRPPSGHA